MQPIDVQIHQVAGQLGIHSTPPNLDVKSKAADIEIKTTPATLDLKIEPPEIFIDLRASFDSMGLQGTYSLASSMAEEAKQACDRGVDRRVSVGHQMSNPHMPSIGKIVAQASQPPEKELVIGLSPSASPNISARLGTVRGTYTPARVNLVVKEGKITSNFTWGKVNLYMEREPAIDIKS